jgi:hypothetical protein
MFIGPGADIVPLMRSWTKQEREIRDEIIYH